MSEQKLNEDEKILGQKDIEYYYRKNRFLNLLKDTNKHKDLWKSKEAF